MYSQVSGAGQFLYSAICQLGVYLVAVNVYLGKSSSITTSSSTAVPKIKTMDAARAMRYTLWILRRGGLEAKVDIISFTSVCIFEFRSQHR